MIGSQIFAGRVSKPSDSWDDADAVYPVSVGPTLAAIFSALGSVLTLAFPVGDYGATVALAVALGAFALRVLGPIKLGPNGIRLRRRLLVPYWERRLLWDEIDSAYEDLVETEAGPPIMVVVVSGGPDRTITFAGHDGLESFLKQIESRGVPIGRIPIP